MHKDVFQLMFPLMHKDMNTLTLMSLLLTSSDDTWVVNGFFINSQIMSQFNMSQFEAQSQLIHFSSSSSEFHDANSNHPSSNDISSNEFDLTGKMCLSQFLYAQPLMRLMLLQFFVYNELNIYQNECIISWTYPKQNN